MDERPTVGTVLGAAFIILAAVVAIYRYYL
jgi:hypothetical protein